MIKPFFEVLLGSRNFIYIILNLPNNFEIEELLYNIGVILILQVITQFQVVECTVVSHSTVFLHLMLTSF